MMITNSISDKVGIDTNNGLIRGGCHSISIATFIKKIKITLLNIGVISGLITLPLRAYACQIPKSYYSNVFCTASSQYFLALKDSGQPVALINNAGRPVADLTRYNSIDVTKLKGGLVPIQRYGKVGYIDMSGREVIPPVYDIITNDIQTKGWARAVSNNRIVVKKGGKFGVVDTNNRVIVPFSASYQSISDYNGKLASIQRNHQTEWIDLKGKTTQPATNISTNSVIVPISRHIATIMPEASKSTAIASAETISVNEKPKPSPMHREVWQPEKRDGKWGFVNRAGVPMITFSFSQVTSFSEGLAGVRMQDKWGFVNLAGELVIPFNFEESAVRRDDGVTYKGVQPFVFTEGKAWVANMPNGTQMCINFEGNFVRC